MMLSAGTRLGPYEILSPLCAGGMGEVYRARDRKLDQDVAIRVLPQPLAADAVVIGTASPCIRLLIESGADAGSS